MAKTKLQSAPKLETKICRVDPKSLKPRDRNARFMTAAQMGRLIENIERDGGLTSLPLAYQRQNNVLEILSGHHRIEAAVKAGLSEIDVLVIVTPLDEERLTAIQLSHNAITGQDDPSILAALYDSLDLDSRRYSGLGDDILGGVDRLDLAGLSLGAVAYQDIRISFLPDDAEQFIALTKRIGKAAGKRPELVARYADFDVFFETLIATKNYSSTFNAGIALGLMAELAAERLAQLETADGDQEGTAEN